MNNSTITETKVEATHHKLSNIKIVKQQTTATENKETYLAVIDNEGVKYVTGLCLKNPQRK